MGLDRQSAEGRKGSIRGEKLRSHFRAVERASMSSSQGPSKRPRVPASERKDREGLCRLLRRHGPLLGLDGASDANSSPSDARAGTPTDDGTLSVFRAAAHGRSQHRRRPRPWSAHGVSNNSVLTTSIDLWDTSTRTCHETTQRGRDCLQHLATKPGGGDCAAYCVRRSVPCKVWTQTLVERLGRVVYLTLEYTGSVLDLEANKKEPVTVDVRPLFTVLDAERQPLLTLSKDRSADSWSFQGSDRFADMLGTPVVKSYQVAAKSGPLQPPILVTVKTERGGER